MGLFKRMGDSFGCSATGERLVSAARDGDVQEARAILEFNPRLARYSTFGVGNSPLHSSAAQGHHEIVSLLIESGVDVNMTNCKGQTALMQACSHGHWKVVQILILFQANIHRTDAFSGCTALHFAALKGHERCIQLLVADYVPSVPDFWSIMQKQSRNDYDEDEFNEIGLQSLINKKADGGVTALHFAALHGHVDCVQLLLNLGASVSEVTVNDGSTIDLIGAGSTPLHYAACGGSLACCQLLLAGGASLTAENAHGWTPLLVARSWHKNNLEDVLSKGLQDRFIVSPSPYLALPLMSIVTIARSCGWRKPAAMPACPDPCVICFEMKCMVAARGCNHEFCTQCALSLCSTSNGSTTMHGPVPPGAIPCPLCRHPIVSFIQLTSMTPLQELHWSSSSLSLCSLGPVAGPSHLGSCMTRDTGSPRFRLSSVQLGCSSFNLRGKLPPIKLNTCINANEATSCVVPCLRLEHRRTAALTDRSRRSL